MTAGANGGQTGPPPTYQPAGQIWQTGEYTYVDPHGTVWHGTSGEMQIQAFRDAVVRAAAHVAPQPPGDPMSNIDRLRALAEKPMESMRATELAEIRVALPWLLDTLEVREAARSDLRQQWEAGYEAGIRNADHRLRLALDILDGQFQPTDRIGDLHAAMTNILKGEL